MSMMETKNPYPIRGHLPEDLCREILSRLPVRSLLRFRCVSKPWQTLVDDDTKFARSHLTNFIKNREETGLFVLRTTEDLNLDCDVRCSDTFDVIPETRSTTMRGDWDVVSSLDGLILLKSGIDLFRVWNPSIRKFREIPPFLHQIQGSPNVKDLGFGYDSVAESYKLVRLVFVNNIMQSVAIYSFGDNSWKMVEFKGKESSSCTTWRWQIDSLSRSIYFQGCLYFVAKEEKSRGVWDLVSFDFNNEVFSCTTTPSFMRTKTLIFVRGGCSLVAVDIDSRDKPIWVLDWESMGWKKHCSCNYSAGSDIYYFKKNGDFLTKCGVVKAIGMTFLCAEVVSSYNPEKDEHSKLQELSSCGVITNVLCYSFISS